MMNEYVIAKYIRLSMDDAISESLSIPNQHLLLDRHIDSLDLPNVTVMDFVDNGHSGTNLERPAVQEMLDLVRSGGVNCIVVKDFSRFSRNALESGYFIEQVFPLYRIRFIAVDDYFDSDDYKGDTGGIDVAFKFLMHEYYSKDLSAKVKSTKRVQMINGENIVANAVYGYRKNDSGKWEPDTEAAEIVRRIFAMALEGLPTAMIRDRMHDDRIPTPKEYLLLRRGKEIEVKCVWSARMVLTILANEQYTGMYVSGKQEQKAIGSHSKIHIDPSKWIRIPDSHPAIVSKETYAAVQSLRNRFQNSTTVKPVGNLLMDENRLHASRMIRGDNIAGTPIYGYLKQDDGSWKIDMAVSGVIQEIFDMAIRNLSYADICVSLCESGYPTPSEHIRKNRGCNFVPECRWTIKSVRAILKNIQYTGAYVSGKTLKDYATGKQYHTAESDWIIIPGKHPAIISADTFDQVQAITRNSNTRRKNMRPQDNLLRGGILKCGCCGYALAYDSSARGGVYRCQHTLPNKDAECHKMRAGASELDDAVLTVIKKHAELVLESGDLSELRKVGADEKRMAECNKKIARYVEQQQAHYEQLVLHEIDRDTYRTLSDECTAQLDIWKRQLALCRQSERDRQADKKVMAIAKEALSETAAPRDIVEALVDKVFVSPGNRIEIHWKMANFDRVKELGGR